MKQFSTSKQIKLLINFLNVKTILLFCIFSFHLVIAPIPSINKPNSTDSIITRPVNINNQQDLQDLTFLVRLSYLLQIGIKP